MGFLWAIFMPVVAVAAGIFIKKAMAVVPTGQGGRYFPCEFGYRQDPKVTFDKLFVGFEERLEETVEYFRKKKGRVHDC